MLRSPIAIVVPSMLVLALAGCTAAAPVQPAVSTGAGGGAPSPTAPSTTAAPTGGTTTVSSAGQARLLVPDDPDAGALAASGARFDPLAPFALTTVGASVSDAHLAQSVTPTSCGVVNGLWYASAADRTVTDPLLAVGFTPVSASDGAFAIEAVRVFPTAAGASTHFARLADALASCSSFTLTDTQAGTFEYATSDVQADADTIAFRRSVRGAGADGDAATVAPGDDDVRVRLFGNVLVTVSGVGAPEVVDAVDRFVEDHAESSAR